MPIVFKKFLDIHMKREKSTVLLYLEFNTTTVTLKIL